MIRMMLTTAACVLALTATAGAKADPPAGKTRQEQIRELERKKAALEAEIDVLRNSVEKYNQLARELDAEARECLQANPPRYSSASMFQSQANQARAEARRAQDDIRSAQAKIRQIDAELARLRSGG